MRHQTFRTCWEQAQAGARLFPQAGHAEETLDLASMSTRYSSLVSNTAGHDRGPYYVTARISWERSALLVARGETSEDDVHTALYGRARRRPGGVTPPCVRVDVRFNATLPHGKPVSVPSVAALKRWSTATAQDIDTLWFPPLRRKRGRRMGGLPVIEQWSGGPAAEMEFTDGGELRLAALRLDAWRFVEFPPAWSGDESLPTTLQKDLDLLAVRVRQGLEAWRKSLPLLADALHGPLH